MAGNLRSPRKRALEIGTASGGFPTDVPYDTDAGAPAADVSGTYSDPVGDISPKPGGGPPPSPFGNLR